MYTLACLSSDQEEISSGNESRENSANGHYDLRRMAMPPIGAPLRSRPLAENPRLSLDGK